MEKLSKVMSSLKKFDTTQIANDKAVLCLAVIGMVSTIKFFWHPLSNIIAKNKIANLKNQQESLKQKYGGEWALFIGQVDDYGEALAMELAREGYNIIFVC